MAEILVVDDDREICTAFERFLGELGHETRVASRAREALAAVAESAPDLVLLDLRMPGMDGLEALRAIRQLDPKAQVILMTAYGTSQTTIEASRLGAFDHLAKPLDLDVVRPVIERALEARALSRDAEQEPRESWKDYALVNLVGSSAPMQQIYKRIGLLTTRDVPVLLAGEPGVGKELVGKTIHFNSARKDQPFRSLDCAVLSEARLELELAPRGEAEEDADRDAGPGSSGAGSILLANVEALSPTLQAVLLARLEAGAPLPSDPRPSPGEPRILAATTRNLDGEMRAGRLRADLADRLAAIRIDLPPLRERPDDLPELVEFFIDRFNAQLGRDVRGVEDRVLEAFREHAWPRNVDELRNVMQRACVLAPGDVITRRDIGDGLRGEAPSDSAEVDADLVEALRRALHQRVGSGSTTASPFHEVVGRAEAVLIREALALTSGNQVKAAALLGLNRTTLRKKIKLYGL